MISTDRVAAVELLRKGDLVALPTETVYGLAAKALNPIAVAKIFEAKERPRFDPLIVHLPNRDWLERIVDVPADDRQLLGKLADNFWPGPFTMILPKREIIPDIVTAGLSTVAVRLSAHPVFSEIVGELHEPLAAPSANRFGRVSPTTAQHVLDELDGRIPLIIDAGPTQHGIESTIVAIGNSKIAILRRGPITHEQLSEFAEVSSVVSTPTIFSPGQLPSHYAPRTPLCLIDNAEAFPSQKHQRVGLLAWNGDFPRRSRVRCRSNSKRPGRLPGSGGEFISLPARTRHARSRPYRCGTRSVSGTRCGDNGSTGTSVTPIACVHGNREGAAAPQFERRRKKT